MGPPASFSRLISALQGVREALEVCKRHYATLEVIDLESCGCTNHAMPDVVRPASCCPCSFLMLGWADFVRAVPACIAVPPRRWAEAVHAGVLELSSKALLQGDNVARTRLRCAYWIALKRRAAAGAQFRAVAAHAMHSLMYEFNRPHITASCTMVCVCGVFSFSSPIPMVMQVKALDTCRALRVLKLGYNSFGNESMKVLKPALERAIALTNLHLQNAGIAWAGMNTLVPVIQSMLTLQVCCVRAVASCPRRAGHLQMYEAAQHAHAADTLRIVMCSICERWPASSPGF